MPTLKQLETALINADKAGDAEAARALAAEIKRVRAQSAPKPAKQAPKAKEPSMLEAFSTGVDQAKLNVFRALMKGARKIGLAGPETAEEQRQRANFQREFGNRMAQVQQARPYSFGAGQLTGETVLTAPVVAGGGKAIEKLGSGLIRVAPRVGAGAGGVARAGRVTQRVGRAVQTGGIGSGRTAAQTTAMGRGARLGQLAERMAGGAIAGGAGAGLVGQDISEGAVFGAGLPVVASVLKRIGGGLADITKLPRQKAAEILRRAFADNLDEARAAFAELSPDDQRMAEQFLIESGIEPDAVFGLGKTLQEQTETGATAFRQAFERDAAARKARLAEAAGGATMEEIRAAARAGRKAVTEEMKPTREEMYRMSGYASEVVPAKLAEAANLENLAAEQSAQARRMVLGSERAETRRGLMETANEARQAEYNLGLRDVFEEAFPREAVNIQSGLAGAMEKRGEKAALKATAARFRAQDIYDEVDNMAAEGLRPMRAVDLIAPLQRKLQDPTIAVDTLESNTIRGVIRKLKAATDQNGMLNPRALGKIMRSGIGDLVEMWSRKVSSGAAPSSGTVQRGQSLALSMRDMIKDTLREGGAGDLVDEFFQRSEQGYAAVNRGELAGEAFRLYKQDPDKAAEFRALMAGERPKVVGKIMGGGPEGELLANAFAQDPTRLAALQQSAREMETLNRMAELRSSGAGPASRIMIKETPTRLSRGLSTLAGIPYTPLGYATRGLEQVERAYMSPRVEQQLVPAYIRATDMGELLSTTPGKARISEQVSKLPPSVRNAMAQLLRGYYLGPPPENNYSQ